MKSINEFKKGQMLVVEPDDDDDPVANSYSGRRCRFERYFKTGFGSTYCYVQFSTKGKAIALRETDLRPE